MAARAAYPDVNVALLGANGRALATLTQAEGGVVA